jgi:SAM-dependent methyltransferase
MTQNRFKEIAHLLHCLECHGGLDFAAQAFKCQNCLADYPIVNGVPRFVPVSFYAFDQQQSTIQEKTKNYFGYEWEHFKNWGFIDENEIPVKDRYIFEGGYNSSRTAAFDTKCRLNDNELAPDTITLDAGCGNGRYTFEAGHRSKGTVIGVDIGYGSVQSARDNTQELENVIIMQCDLFRLPFKNGVVNNAFSNGVLMHTGNAEEAFAEIGRTIKPAGVFVAHVYNKLNPIWEFNDWWMRKITTQLSVLAGMSLAKILSKTARIVMKIPGGFQVINYFFRLQPSEHHMFDWYSAPVASHHTPQELATWFQNNQFKLVDTMPKRGFWRHPWASNLKGQKQG